jgi:hypothetical protein
MLCVVPQCLELRQWPEAHPLRQMEMLFPDLLYKMKDRGLSLNCLRVAHTHLSYSLMCAASLCTMSWQDSTMS